MEKPRQRASMRLVKKVLLEHASKLPALKRKRVERMMTEYKNVWPTVQFMYNINSGNTSARNRVSKVFHPIHRKYNTSRNKILSNNNANRAIKRSIVRKNIANILVPVTGGNRTGGGVNPGYVANALKNKNLKYAIVNVSNGKLKALALVNNKPNSRYVNVIAGLRGYGHPMMNKILNNAKAAGKKRVNLKAVTNVTNNSKANNVPLVKWYVAKGFRRTGTLNNGLLPMSRFF